MQVVSQNRIGRRIVRHIEALLRRSRGKQPIGSAEHYLSDTFHNLGYHVLEQPFSVTHMPQLINFHVNSVAMSVLISAAFILLESSPFGALMLASAALTILVLTSRWAPLSEWLLRTGRKSGTHGNNIIAMQPEQEQKITIVFEARMYHRRHSYSNALTDMLLNINAVCFFLSAFMIATVALFQLPRMWVLVPFIPAYLITIFLQFNRNRRTTDPVETNATGAGVLLELAQAFAHTESNANVVFVASEGIDKNESAAMTLMEDPSLQERFPPERTIIIVLDDVGRGSRVQITDRFGVPAARTGVLVSKLLQEAVDRFGLKKDVVWQHLALNSNCLAYNSHGYQSVELSTRTAKNEPPPSQDPDDELKISLSSLEYIYALGLEIVDSIPRLRGNLH